jgi:hypothetical protein
MPVASVRHGDDQQVTEVDKPRLFARGKPSTNQSPSRLLG